MEEPIKIHVGLDVHKDSISVAAAEPGRSRARLIGKVARVDAFKGALDNLARNAIVRKIALAK